MDNAAKTIVNIQASAAALHVLLSIHDGKLPEWTTARLILRDDKRKLVQAEIFIASVTGAFTALTKGGKFPSSRSSLNTHNEIMEAAEDAAHAKILAIKNIKAENKMLEDAKRASLQVERADETFSPTETTNRNFDGANSRTNSTMSKAHESNFVDDGEAGDANFDLVPNPPIQSHKYNFWPPLPEDIDGSSPRASRAQSGLFAEPKNPTTAELIASMRVYKGPFAPNGDTRHPTVIEHELKTGIRNVVGTGLNGRLTPRDIMAAATVVENMPDHLKTTFMSDTEKGEYEKMKARQAKEAEKKRARDAKEAEKKAKADAKAAREAAIAAEANQREKLKIATAGNDSEQENPVRKSNFKSLVSKPPRLDLANFIIESSKTPNSAAHNPLRKSKSCTVVEDSESEDTAPSPRAPPSVGSDVFDGDSTPLNFMSRRTRRLSSTGSGPSVVVRQNGSPVASVPPHELRMYSKRFTSPAPSLNNIVKNLVRPAEPKKPNRLDSRQPIRDRSESTEELTQPRAPMTMSAPRPIAKKSLLISGKTKKVQLLSKTKAKSSASRDSSSFGVTSDDSALLERRAPLADGAQDLSNVLNGPAAAASPSRKRRRDSTASHEQVPSHYFPPPPKRAQPAKLRQHAMSARSSSPAPSVVSTAASERPRRVKKPTMRQSLPLQRTQAKRMSADRSMMAKPPVVKKQTKVAKTAAAGATEPKVKEEDAAKDDEIINKPVAVTDEEYDVEAIVGHKIHEKRVYYRVKWQGYPEDKNTWEPAENLHDAKKILNDYNSSLQVNGAVEKIVAHRQGKAHDPDTKGPLQAIVYLVKWRGWRRDYNSWEREETIRARGGVKTLLYYRIRNNAGFGACAWTKRKQAQAIKLLREEGLQPEVGGRISAQEMGGGKRDEDEDRDELALSAREESVLESAHEEFMMNQTI